MITARDIELILLGLLLISESESHSGREQAVKLREMISNGEIQIIDIVQSKLSRPKHSTEEKYPEQTARFKEILDELYQTHLKKNADYSAMNILGTGAVGITVRFWDKCARLMNLMGFDIKTGNYSGPKQNLVEDESVIDTAIDAAVYGIIFRIYNEGKWGK